MSCQVMSYHVIMSCHIMSHNIMWCDVMSCHVMSSDIVWCHVISCRVMSFHIMTCHVMSYHVMSCHVMSCDVMSYHIMWRHVISYHVISYHIMSFHTIRTVLDNFKRITLTCPDIILWSVCPDSYDGFRVGPSAWSCHAMPYRIILSHSFKYHVTSDHTIGIYFHIKIRRIG